MLVVTDWPCGDFGWNPTRLLTTALVSRAISWSLLFPCRRSNSSKSPFLASLFPRWAARCFWCRLFVYHSTALDVALSLLVSELPLAFLLYSLSVLLAAFRQQLWLGVSLRSDVGEQGDFLRDSGFWRLYSGKITFVSWPWLAWCWPDRGQPTHWCSLVNEMFA